jgi:hypothetical protein
MINYFNLCIYLVAFLILYIILSLTIVSYFYRKIKKLEKAMRIIMFCNYEVYKKGLYPVYKLLSSKKRRKK